MPGAGIPEFMGRQPASGHSAPTTMVAPAQATGVDDIANALDSYFKAHYPTSDFTSALKQLTQVRDAEDRGDRRAVEVEKAPCVSSPPFVRLFLFILPAMSAASLPAHRLRRSVPTRLVIRGHLHLCARQVIPDRDRGSAR